jgi:enterochelin esterase family protein
MADHRLLESRKLLAFDRSCRRGGKRSIERNWTQLTRRGLPLVERIPGDPENRWITFVWRPRGRVTSPSVYTPIANFATRETALQPLGTTGVWYRSFRVSRRTRASYGFSRLPTPATGGGENAWLRYISSVKPDPQNSNRIFFEKDPDDPRDSDLTLSVVELPGAPAQPWSRVPPSSHWTEEHHRMRSPRLRGVRSVWVELPSDFRPRKIQYNLLVVFDGLTYRTSIPTPRIVENLVDAGRISPTVIVLVGNAPGARTEELGANPAFADFLARELLPWLRRQYRFSHDPSRTVLAGSSLGGVASAHAALRYPHLFGNVLAQSGAFQFPPERKKGAPASLMQAYARSPRRSLRFYLDGGTHETVLADNMPVSLLGSVRHMRDVLVAKGYPVTYVEFEGGHDYACWKGTLADGLIHLLGRS